MSAPYARGFRKIASIAELPEGQPKLFRTGGSAILILKTADGVRAADATVYVEEQQKRVEAGSAGASSARVESPAGWSEVAHQRPLAAEVRDDAVWVCVDAAS